LKSEDIEGSRLELVLVLALGVFSVARIPIEDCISRSVVALSIYLDVGGEASSLW